MTNLRPARAGFSEPRVTEDGAATREVDDARVTGPRSAISITLGKQTRRMHARQMGKKSIWGDRLRPALLGSGNSRLRAGICAGITRSALGCDVGRDRLAGRREHELNPP